MKVEILNLLKDGKIEFSGTRLECARHIQKLIQKSVSDYSIAQYLTTCKGTTMKAYGYDVQFTGEYVDREHDYINFYKPYKLKTKKPVIEMPDWKPPIINKEN